ncbi:hypothetical protein [Rhizohabitans arisaemae]|uniref:hypothetical protein n=1 Tax=Rhizohabitans arisaemae TaxID=2720610 RepID=UPI0024B1D6D3|nr:hypothetical protein [Rhizohabitans arisaemae]
MLDAFLYVFATVNSAAESPVTAVLVLLAGIPLGGILLDNLPRRGVAKGTWQDGES